MSLDINFLLDNRTANLSLNIDHNSTSPSMMSTFSSTTCYPLSCEHEKLYNRSIIVYYSCAMALGIILNSTTLAVLVCGTNVGKEIRMQLTSLAVADVLWALTYPLCKICSPPTSQIFLYVAVYFVTISFSCTGAIGVERCVVVYFPLKTRTYSKRQKLHVIGIAWLVGTLGGTFYIFETTSFIVDIFGLILSLLSPVAYLLIMVKVCRQKRIGEKNTDAQQAREAQRKGQVSGVN